MWFFVFPTDILSCSQQDWASNQQMSIRETTTYIFFFLTSFSKPIFQLPNLILSTNLFTQSPSVSKVCCKTFIIFNVWENAINSSFFSITFPFEMSIANQQIKTERAPPAAWWNACISVECCAWWLCVQQHLGLNTANLWALFVFKHLLSKD